MRRKAYLPTSVPQTHKNQRGVALITALLLLLLLVGLTLAMAMSAGSDMMINNYYGNYRGSFFAADSGLNIARQDMVNQLEAAVPKTFAQNVAPISLTEQNTVQQNIAGTYGTDQSVDNGGAANSWPEQFKITNVTLALTSCTPVGGGGTCAAPTGNPTEYDYIYTYNLTAQGQARGTENTTLAENGQLFLNAEVALTQIKKSFAGWGMFINTYNLCNDELVQGTITGPVFTNGGWTFGTGKYEFTDPVGSVNQDAGFQFNNGNCNQVNAPSDTSGGTTIAPQFDNGFNRGQNPVPLPQNSFSQERAVLDGKGTNDTAPSNAELNAALLDVNGNPYPANGTNSGVFLPYTITTSVDPTTGQKVTKRTFTGGGILVQGNASVQLAPAAACSSSSCGQVYTINQNGVVTTVTVDDHANQTTISSGSVSQTVTGVPEQIDPNGTVDGPATMLYVNGSVTSLSGPGEGQTAIQDGTQLTITSAQDVTVTGDIKYKQEPVTFTATSNTPADSVIPGNDTGEVLGIFTTTGNIVLNNQQSDNNLEVDASLAMISQNGTGGLINPNNQIQKLTIVGGRIQNDIDNINTVTRNVWFDRRFLKGGFAPPWFPSTTVTPGTNSARFNAPTIKSTFWKDTSRSNY